jgi:hypothetical protein
VEGDGCVQGEGSLLIERKGWYVPYHPVGMLVWMV